MWQLWSERVDASISSRIKILLDVKQHPKATEAGDAPMSTHAKGKQKREALGKGGVEGIDVGYSELKGHVEKSIFLLAGDEANNCAVCSRDMGKSSMALICPQEGCRTASHVTCLAINFLKDEGHDASILPTSGRCPKCKSELQWVDLVKEMSLRMRGDKEVDQLMRKPKERKTKAAKSSKAMASLVASGNPENEDDGDLDDGPAEDAIYAGAAVDDVLPDDWLLQEDDDDDMMSVTSAASSLSDSMDAASPRKASVKVPRLPVVIEDSEWDDAEILD